MSEVTIYYLEMLNQDQHIAKACPADLTIEEACVKQYQVNRMLYGLIGESWQWNDKADWTSAMWKEFAESDSLRTWIAYGAIPSELPSIPVPLIIRTHWPTTGLVDSLSTKRKTIRKARSIQFWR